MRNKELFDKSVSILIKAFHEETLQHWQPCGCGLGNLIAANLGIRVIKVNDGVRWEHGHPFWTHVHCEGKMRPRKYTDEYMRGLKQIESTGYRAEETCSLERAFESERGGGDIDGYRGLMAMVDTLTDIHYGDGRDNHEAKTKFKNPELYAYKVDYKTTNREEDRRPYRERYEDMYMPRPTGRYDSYDRSTGRYINDYDRVRGTNESAYERACRLEKQEWERRNRDSSLRGQAYHEQVASMIGRSVPIYPDSSFFRETERYFSELQRFEPIEVTPVTDVNSRAIMEASNIDYNESFMAALGINIPEPAISERSFTNMGVGAGRSRRASEFWM